VERNLKEKILKISEGLLASLTDFVLSIFFFVSESIDPKVAHSLPLALAKVDKRMQKLNYQKNKKSNSICPEKRLDKRKFRINRRRSKKIEGAFSRIF